MIREKFDAHKDGQEGSELRNKYEDGGINGGTWSTSRSPSGALRAA